MVIVSDYTVTYNHENDIFCWEQRHILLPALWGAAFLPGFLCQDHAAGGRDEAEISDPQAEMQQLRETPPGDRKSVV